MGAASILLLAALVAPAPSDTVMTVRTGDRLVLANLEGSVVVTGVDGDRLRMVGSGDGRRGTGPRRNDGRIVYDGRMRRRDLRVEVPRWLPVEIRGHDVAVRIAGSAASLSIRTIEGDVEITDAAGDLDVHSVDGEIRVADVSGRLRLRSVDEDIFVRGARGTLVVGTTDGDLILDDVDVDELDAATTDGDIAFSGVFRSGGRYSLVTHAGDVVAAVPAGADVDVEVSTFSGSFQAGFPVLLDGVRSGRRAAFTLGDGGASLLLESFSGDVEVRRPDR